MSLNDQTVLASDTTFQGRVRAALAAACEAISTEATTVAYHYRRIQFVIQVLPSIAVGSGGQNWPLIFATTVATDPSVISDATAAGTVALTAGNVAAQAALVTDAHINNAVSSQFNSFFQPF
jgi:hypothetical protein